MDKEKFVAKTGPLQWGKDISIIYGGRFRGKHQYLIVCKDKRLHAIGFCDEKGSSYILKELPTNVRNQIRMFEYHCEKDDLDDLFVKCLLVHY